MSRTNRWERRIGPDLEHEVPRGELAPRVAWCFVNRWRRLGLDRKRVSDAMQRTWALVEAREARP